MQSTSGMESFRLCIDQDGSTCYAKNASAFATCITTKLDKGRCVLSTRQLGTSTGAFTETAVTVCVTGEREQHMCKICLKKIDKKAKARNDHPMITFCSMSCLEQAGDYLDFCGPHVSAISKIADPAWINVAHILKLAVHYLFTVHTAQSAPELARLLSVLQLESHEEICTPELRDASRWLLQHIHATHANEILTALATRGFDITESQIKGNQKIGSAAAVEETPAQALMYRLLRVIKYNAQPLPLHGMQKVELLALLPTVARINHSCRPNAVLIYDAHTSDKHPTAVCASIVAISDIAADEELTVSYLQPLCAPVQTRRDLLRQAFAFHCQCERCVAEENEAAITEPTLGKIAQIEKQLQLSASAAASAQALLLVEELDRMMETAEDLLRGTVLGTREIVAVHDASALVQQQVQMHAKAPTAVSQSAQSRLNVLLLRAQLATAKCWEAAGCERLLPRIETMVAAAQTWIRMKNGMPAEMLTATATARVRDSVRLALNEAVHVLNSVYLSTVGERGEGTASTTEYLAALHGIAVSLEANI